MLDLARLAPQVREFIVQQTAEASNQAHACEAAVSAFDSITDSSEELAARIKALHSSRLIAEPILQLDKIAPLPSKTDRHSVAAVDGSQIALDRHEFAQCFLLNIGSVVLHYGSGERPILTSVPTLCFSENDLYEEEGDELRPISSRGLAIRRHMRESAALVDVLHSLGARDDPSVALMDGTLIPWILEAESASTRTAALRDFEMLLNAGRGLRIPIAGYISRPASRDVSNLLRASLCGFERAPCALKCTSRNLLKKGAACEYLREITDRALFHKVLKPGERSPVYLSRSKVLKELEPENRIAFFYMRTSAETARVEIPAWVAEYTALLERVHSLVYDQVQKGEGYPRALTEAHEMANVRGQQKAQFFNALETAFVRSRLPVEVTRKALAKRTRGV